MARRVRWTETALDDLENIAAFIARFKVLRVGYCP